MRVLVISLLLIISSLATAQIHCEQGNRAMFLSYTEINPREDEVLFQLLEKNYNQSLAAKLGVPVDNKDYRIEIALIKKCHRLETRPLLFSCMWARPDDGIRIYNQDTGDMTRIDASHLDLNLRRETIEQLQGKSVRKTDNTALHLKIVGSEHPHPGVDHKVEFPINGCKVN